MKRLAVILVLTIFSAFAASAQNSGWRIDKAHTSVGFAVRHMVISEVTGNFRDFDITVNSTKEDFSDAVVDANIKVASINTDNERRDNHLKSDDFFNAEKFPEIKFKSALVEKVGENKYKITGDLTIRDSTKKVTFDATLNGMLKTSRGVLAAWKATISINRFDFGLKWNRTIETGGLIAGETINVTLNVELQKPNG
ncbi:MAG: YceI family protein [Bacteroidota bacterium]